MALTREILHMRVKYEKVNTILEERNCFFKHNLTKHFKQKPNIETLPLVLPEKKRITILRVTEINTKHKHVFCDTKIGSLREKESKSPRKITIVSW